MRQRLNRRGCRCRCILAEPEVAGVIARMLHDRVFETQEKLR